MYYLYYCSKPNISFITNGLIGKKKSYKAHSVRYLYNYHET